MVVQDYFTKWAEAIPLQNQTAVLITEELVKLCATYGLPEIVHSDQGRAFESTILRQTLEAFGTKKTHTNTLPPSRRWDGGVPMRHAMHAAIILKYRIYYSHHNYFFNGLFQRGRAVSGERRCLRREWMQTCMHAY